MDEEQKKRVQALVEELDLLVPRVDACVLLKVDGGGPDESKVIANEAGFLRLGIEFLKAPFLSASDEEGRKENEMDGSIDYLISEQSDIFFHSFRLDKTLHADEKLPITTKQSLLDKAYTIGCGILFLFLAYATVIGLITIVLHRLI